MADVGIAVDEALADVVRDVLYSEASLIIDSRQIVSDWNALLPEISSEATSTGVPPEDSEARLSDRTRSASGAAVHDEVFEVVVGGYAERYLIAKKAGKSGVVLYNPTLTAELLATESAGETRHAADAGTSGYSHESPPRHADAPKAPERPDASADEPTPVGKPRLLEKEQLPPSIERSARIKEELAKLKQETRKIQVHGQRLEERRLHLQQELECLQQNGCKATGLHPVKTAQADAPSHAERLAHEELQSLIRNKGAAERSRLPGAVSARLGVRRGSPVRQQLLVQQANLRHRQAVGVEVGSERHRSKEQAAAAQQEVVAAAFNERRARVAQSARHAAPPGFTSKAQLEQANPGLVHRLEQTAAAAPPKNARDWDEQAAAAKGMVLPDVRGQRRPGRAPENAHISTGPGAATAALESAARQPGRRQGAVAHSARSHSVPPQRAGDPIGMDPQTMAMLLSMQPLLMMANIQQLQALLPETKVNPRQAASARRFSHGPPMLNPVTAAANPCFDMQGMLLRALEVEQLQAAQLQAGTQRVDHILAKNDAVASKHAARRR